ncbi:hypothetical protein [Caenispirillum salinarum]|uniref:hypothetical protein n=1 Tax=Caenispirillum salinarum TaxID=859058 RepID=UPI003850047C
MYSYKEGDSGWDLIGALVTAVSCSLPDERVPKHARKFACDVVVALRAAGYTVSAAAHGFRHLKSRSITIRHPGIAGEPGILLLHARSFGGDRQTVVVKASSVPFARRVVREMLKIAVEARHRSAAGMAQDVERAARELGHGMLRCTTSSSPTPSG